MTLHSRSARVSTPSLVRNAGGLSLLILHPGMLLLISSSDSLIISFTPSVSCIIALRNGTRALGSPIFPRAQAAFCLTLQSSSVRARMSGSTARLSPILPNDSAAFHLLDGSSSSSMAIKCPSRSSSSVIILWSSSHPVFQILLARGGELSTPPRTPQSYKSRVQQESRTLMIRA